MRNTTYVVAMLLSLTFLSCNTQEITTLETNKNPNFRVIENTVTDWTMRASADDPCSSTTLIAGQNQDAGVVTINNDGANLIITYTTNEDWSIDLTHLSIGNCNEQWVPTTGSGNPKIGQFEHTEPHSVGTNEVVYLISLSALNEEYCFATHAEVTGPTGGETAWGEGTDFDGNSWAMYVEALLSDCDIDGDAGTTDPNK